MRLAARQSVGGPVQREVIQAYIHQELEARADGPPDGGRHLRTEGPQLIFVAVRRVGTLGAAPSGLQERLDLVVVQRSGLQRPEVGVGVQHAHVARLRDVQPAHPHRQNLGLVSRAAAGGAGTEFHHLFHLLAHELGLGIQVAALQIDQHALELGLEAHGLLTAAPVDHLEGFAGAVQNGVLYRLGELMPGRFGVELHKFGQRLDLVPVIHAAARALLAPGQDRALGQREFGIDDAVCGKFVLVPQAGTVRAGPVGIVEAERSRLQFLQHAAVFRAGELFTVQFFRATVWEKNAQQALAPAQAQLDALGDARTVGVLDVQAVNHHVHVVLLELLQLQLLGLVHLVDGAVYPHPRKALALQVTEQLAVLALAPAHHRGQQNGPLAVVQAQQLVCNLAGTLALDLAPADRAVRRADAGVQQPQVVVNLGDGTHRAARVVAGCFLVDGNSRRQPLDAVHVRLPH